MQGELCIMVGHKGNGKMDWNKIEQLLNIGSKAAEHGPKYTPLVSAVQAELEEHVDAAKKMLAEKAKAAEEEAGRLRAEAANKAREEAEKLKAEEQVQAKAVEDRARAAVGEATQEDKAPTGSDANIGRRI
jgi:ElaB/YqjD/DUF883 family membrane-anchored ribosome-binding protein